ncbi:hypothetical protein [Metabacillus herbersteinensis]
MKKSTAIRANRDGTNYTEFAKERLDNMEALSFSINPTYYK